VTGGSAGIGEAFARALAGEGTALVLVARRREPLDQLAEELRERHGVEVEVLPRDLTDGAELAEVEARLTDGTRPIDLLVNNAGSETEHGPLRDRDRELLEAEVRLNVVATLRLTHAAVGAMSARGRGYVINVSAGNAFFPTPGSAAYGASKAFINSLTEALAYELRDSGVRLTAVCPGFTRTGAQDRLGLNRHAFPRFMWRNADEVVRDALRASRRKKVVSCLNSSGAVGALAARHVPHRLLTPLIARATARFASG
jgi:short-subunit dehydrogenase